MRKSYAAAIFAASVLLIPSIEGGCRSDQIQIIFEEKVEFSAQAVKRKYSHEKTVETSENFEEKYHSLSIAAQLSWSSELDVAGVAGGAMSLDAKAAFDEVTSSTTSSKSGSELEKIKETNFETGQFQLYRTVEQIVSFDGVKSTVKTVDYINGFPIDQPKTLKDLRQLARDELDFHYPNPIGKITGSTYRETTCIQNGAEYYLGELGSDCPVPGVVSELEECRAAVAQLGRTIPKDPSGSTISSKYAPAGCYYFSNSKASFHNTFSPSDTYDIISGSGGICKKDKTPTAVAPTKPKPVKSWKCKCISPNGSANGITCAFSADSQPDFTNRADFYCAHWQKCRSWDIVDGAKAGVGRYTSYGDKSILESGRYMQRKLKCNPDYCYDHDDPPSYSSYCI